MEIYTALKADHRIVKQILKEIEETTEKTPAKREKLLSQLKEAVVPHARAEERVVYERLKAADTKDADTLAFEAFEEHAVVDRLFCEIEETLPNDKRWTALASVIKEALEHHIEEEEKELFAKAHKAFDHELAVLMTNEFENLKAVFLKEIKTGNLPEQEPSHELVGAA